MPFDVPFPWPTIVFLADVFDASASNAPFHLRRDLEQTEPETLAEILSALSELGVPVRHFREPGEVLKAADTLQGAILFSTYGGGHSRNRLALAPALAETLKLAFVGMDATGQVLSHQKDVAKRLAADAGLATPSFRILRDETDLAVCAELPAPYILKPLAEGSSIGISQSSIIRDPKDGAKRSAELLADFNQPVMMEAFAGGREVSLVAIEADGQAHEAFVEVEVEGQPDYFNDHVFDAREKHFRELPRAIKLIDGELCNEDRLAIRQLLRAVGHYGYVRVDGKLVDGRFVFLELTPDAWLGKRGHIAAGFMAKGWTYAEVLKAILMSAATGNRGPHSNG